MTRPTLIRLTSLALAASLSLGTAHARAAPSERDLAYELGVQAETDGDPGRAAAAFERAYVAYEEKAARGEIKPSRSLPAADLWRKMLTMLFETGHPWITFKDACNIRSPQQHAGGVRSSNLCTEITLNTSNSETAVCHLGSLNLLQHLFYSIFIMCYIQYCCWVFCNYIPPALQAR